MKRLILAVMVCCLSARAQILKLVDDPKEAYEKTARLFATALAEPDYSIAVVGCLEAVKMRQLAGVDLMRDIYHSPEYKAPATRTLWAILLVHMPIKGKFAPVVVYPELMAARELVARFRFIPGFDTKWIIIFRRAQEREQTIPRVGPLPLQLTFPESGLEPLPILHLADRAWGIIRYYDERPTQFTDQEREELWQWPYQLKWDLDTKAFAEDLKLLAALTGGERPAHRPEDLATGLGRRILEILIGAVTGRVGGRD